MKDLYTWAGITVIILASTAGDTLLALAMKQVGDVHELGERLGVLRASIRVATNPMLLLGVGCMTVGFFALLFSLSWGDLSLVGPASISLTFVGNALTGQWFLKERVDKRRWAAAILIAGGVFLLAG